MINDQLLAIIGALLLALSSSVLAQNTESPSAGQAGHPASNQGSNETADTTGNATHSPVVTPATVPVNPEEATGGATAGNVPVQGAVARAQFTTAVVAREPQDNLSRAFSDLEKLYFFTELRDMTGKSIVHRWRYYGEVVAEIPFQVKGPRWRVFSYKSMVESMHGDWSVEVVDQSGHRYSEHTIRVNAPSQNVAPSTIRLIKSTFPDGQYQLINDTLSADQCPPSGRFEWQSHSDKAWTLDMNGTVHMRIREIENDQNTLQPDPQLNSSESNCLMYWSHQFDADQFELVTQLQADCVGEAEDIFSARSYKRRGELFDLSIYDERYVVCRYKLN